MKRVAITGVGMVSAAGLTAEQSWKSALNAETGIDFITLFDATENKVKVAGEVKNFDSSGHFDIKEQRRVTRFVEFATVAAFEAIKDSGSDFQSDPTRFGCAIGVGMGALGAIEDNAHLLLNRGEKRISPFFIPFTIPNMASGYVSMRLGAKGPNVCPTTACASGTHSIGEGFRYIRDGMADAMICGGAEATISKLGISSFTALKALSLESENPKVASRPFDKNRDGFVMGEGAGILILEDMDKAKSRGAKIYAEVIGYGLTGDSHHITAPPERHEGGRRCMEMALKTANLRPEEVDYINAHGTSTQLNDLYESQAIEDLFGSHAKNLLVSSTKGVTGHCLGAAGGIEGVFTALSLHHKIAPPTANLADVDPECRLNYLPNKAVEKNLQVALSNSFGFGGTNATIALRAIS